MKKSILLVVATLVGVTVAPVLTTNSQNVQASETTVREAKSVKVYGPIKNGPLHKYVSNVYRYSSFKTNRNRWVSMYSGNVRLISRGLVPNN